jgi:hypothetical protein
MAFKDKTAVPAVPGRHFRPLEEGAIFDMIYQGAIAVLMKFFHFANFPK